MAVTISPTVAASLRAGRTTLTVVVPLAAKREGRGQSDDVVVRLRSQTSTSGSTHYLPNHNDYDHLTLCRTQV
ncbi:hypothetical protein Ssi02_40220 [Sinosporangium siamense]|uniref:Uncharacterized protein n=1 Tax=Sinosporangium siamense TaxID=1367973 RepID=A0A919RKM2_9ACTN|nr:hypothetical protein Ssi02_40220 [Sinosporangium siamense]